MKRLFLSTLILLCFVCAQSQTKFQIQYQFLDTDSTHKKNVEESFTLLNESYLEEIWEITPLSNKKNNNTYNVKLIKNQNYKRTKRVGKKWRTVNSDYSFLPEASHPLLNKTLQLNISKDSVKINIPKSIENNENLEYLISNSKRIFEYYFLGSKGIADEVFALEKKNKDGSISYFLKNEKDKEYKPSSYLKLEKKGQIGSDFSSFIEYKASFNRKEYSYKTKDSIMIDHVIIGSMKQYLKTININNEPYTVKYRDENHILYDSIYPRTNAILRGRIKGFDPEKHISIDYSESIPGSYKRKAFVFHPDKKGNFEFKMYLDEPMEFDFWHKESTKFVLAPGDDLYLTLDMKEFDETVKWSGTGSEKNQLLAARFLYDEQNKTSARNYYDNTREQITRLTPNEFKNYCDSLSQIRYNFLDKYKVKLTPSDYLANYYDEYFMNYSRKSDFPRLQKYYREREKLEPWDIEDSYNDFKETFHADNDLMSFASRYDREIRSIVFFDIYSDFRNEYEIPVFGLDDNYKKRNYFTELLYSGKSAYILKYKTVGDVIERGSWDLAVEMMEAYRKDFPNTTCLSKLEKAYSKAKTVAPGQFAYDFELEDLEGNKVRLSDFRGKVVYLDFWSTGCAPCRSQIERYAPKLKEKMKDKDIVFMYVACEGNVKRVKKYIEKNDVKGVVLMAKDQEATIRDKYWFNGIPEYYIIDKEGKIVQRDANRPSSLIRNPKPLLDALKTGANSDQEVSKL